MQDPTNQSNQPIQSIQITLIMRTGRIQEIDDLEIARCAWKIGWNVSQFLSYYARQQQQQQQQNLHEYHFQ